VCSKIAFAVAKFIGCSKPVFAAEIVVQAVKQFSLPNWQPAANQFLLLNWAACSEPVLAADFYSMPSW